MPGGKACLLDSNILLRISKADDPQHAAIVQALRALVRQGVRLCYTSQMLAEFWNASTRPLDRNGFGLGVADADRLARVIERDFEFLPDNQEVHERWRRLLGATQRSRSAGPRHPSRGEYVCPWRRHDSDHQCAGLSAFRRSPSAPSR
jgi:hypothetical protein